MKKSIILLIVISIFATTVYSCFGSSPKTAEEVALTFAEAAIKYDFKTMNKLSTSEYQMELQKFQTSNNDVRDFTNEVAKKRRSVKMTCEVIQYGEDDGFYASAEKRGETAFAISVSFKNPENGELIKTEIDIYTVFVDGKWKVKNSR